MRGVWGVYVLCVILCFGGEYIFSLIDGFVRIFNAPVGGGKEELLVKERPIPLTIRWFNFFYLRQKLNVIMLKILNLSQVFKNMLNKYSTNKLFRIQVLYIGSSSLLNAQ